MTVEKIMQKTMEVMNRTERVRNFICSNCNVYEVVFITSDEASDIFNILRETISEIVFESPDSALKKYDRLTIGYIQVVEDYINTLIGDAVASYKVNDKICKLSKTYIGMVAKLLNMSTEEYVMCMLRQSINTVQPASNKVGKVERIPMGNKAV